MIVFTALGVARATLTHCATMLRFISATLSGERHTLN
jgi:hypothetical protein